MFAFNLKEGLKMYNLMYYFFLYLRFGLIIIALVAAVIAMVYFFFKRPKEDGEGPENVITTKSMLNDINVEREKKGLHQVPEINNASGANTGTIARKDKSYKSVPDFFIKLFSKKN